MSQVNVIVITDGNLSGEVAERRFRHDLYYRIAAWICDSATP